MKEEWKCTNPLVALLTVRMAIDGFSVSSLAERLDVSQSYMSQLLREDKLVAATNDSFIRQVADYLSIPAVTCFLLAGKLQGKDFYKPGASFEQLLDKALGVVVESELAMEAAISFEQLKLIPLEVRHLLVLQHEKAYEVELVPEKAGFDELRSALKTRLPFSVTKVKHR